MSVFLDNAATSFPKPEAVYRAMDSMMREVGVAPGRGSYSQAIAAARLVFDARRALAAFFGVADSSRLVFTHSATESLNLAVSGLLKPGDHVVSTSMEHNALLRPLLLARSRGVEVSFVAAGRNGVVSAADVAAALRPTTRLVALAHASNVTGTVQPVAEIAREAKRCGALVLVDAAQTAGYLPIDVAELGIDLLAAPGHKGLFGPPGTGILAVAPGVDLDPLVVGGTGGNSGSGEQPTEMPERYESGTINTPGIAGLGAGVEFVRQTGIEAIRKKSGELTGQLLEGMRGIAGLQLYGTDAPERVGVISFTMEGKDPAIIGFQLDRSYDIAVRVGLQCAPDVHKTIGTYPAGTIRVSPGFFNTPEDIEHFLKALREL
ncbi:aminotransferase class V-fold PLP-dependent enzyme [Geomesophilobacter sediminis]|uniref:cysteine desulfurase n=1 Tax=Geomesophilobacter sediminis TaxID=2798584 RepID=A0A8J7M2H8_9BACT|nr:aminotransferase class V-fold PLP-dependent enzyme [Geomesophilobacter sediminis]MBJ6727530.1 aminotransferase class V-fold PLP-dependent enzyme [Geomesophilobacter sediminis]